MKRTKLIAVAAGAATLLISTGTAVALTSDDRAPAAAARPTAAATTSPDDPTTAPPPGDAVVTRDRAIAIALARTGGGTVTEVEPELEHGRAEWKVRVVTATQRIDLRIDVATGTITRVDGAGVEADDHQDRGGQDSGDDRGGHDSGDDHGGRDSGDDHGGPGRR